MTTSTSFVVSALATFLATSCATAPPPRNAQAAAETSAAVLRAAQEVGSSRSPQAALHLQYAKEQMEAATRLTGDEGAKRAAGLLMRAHADAELAVALAKSHEASTRAKATGEQLKTATPAAR